ncbi:MAG: hypothetical protein HN411_00035 [Waddliaceae bacterium]|jgi:hypothetical protein|nr:hypothetical protein [Waddliaceae bacterium]MBT3578373.1 hypothetical protein [Waddliaceae bacterium]MBT4444544.1 hypothetical protein [Waddliaceae bacterium]MBT6929108.1 hypothetical protein [Waddliaceae bacterium]MBT7264412.1 hypothetical protein [Waddliaceae bacterium]
MKTFWGDYNSWEEAEKAWDAGAEKAAISSPLSTIKPATSRVGIASATAKNLKSKTLWYMLSHDADGILRKNLLKHPLRHSWQFIKSLFRKKAFERKDNFFLYNIKDLEEFEKLLDADDTILLLGFSYCQKPLECPAGRFNDKCFHDPENPKCRQCFIGKAYNALPEDNVTPLVITTAHYIGNKVFELIENNPDKKVVFIMTSCELALTMFGDWGNMVGIKGVGIKIFGNICNTFKAFELAENGVKPMPTTINASAEKQIMSWIQLRASRP